MTNDRGRCMVNLGQMTQDWEVWGNRMSAKQHRTSTLVSRPENVWDEDTTLLAVYLFCVRDATQTTIKTMSGTPRITQHSAHCQPHAGRRHRRRRVHRKLEIWSSKQTNHNTLSYFFHYGSVIIAEVNASSRRARWKCEARKCGTGKCLKRHCMAGTQCITYICSVLQDAPVPAWSWTINHDSSDE